VRWVDSCQFFGCQVKLAVDKIGNGIGIGRHKGSTDKYCSFDVDIIHRAVVSLLARLAFIVLSGPWQCGVQVAQRRMFAAKEAGKRKRKASFFSVTSTGYFSWLNVQNFMPVNCGRPLRGSPVVLLFLIGAFGLQRGYMLPIRFVRHKKRKPETAGKTHQPGLQQQKNNRIENDPYHKTVVPKRKANQQKPQQATQNGKKDTQQVADIAGAVIKAHFNIGILPAHRAMRSCISMFFFKERLRLFGTAFLPGTGDTSNRKRHSDNFGEAFP
jgi:hypothetical protein